MRYLREMTDEGTLEYNGKTILTRHVRDMTTQHYKWLPVSGTVPCGDPQTEEEQTDCLNLIAGTETRFSMQFEVL